MWFRQFCLPVGESRVFPRTMKPVGGPAPDGKAQPIWESTNPAFLPGLSGSHLLAGITVCTFEYRAQRLTWMRWRMTCGPVAALVGAVRCLICFFISYLLKTVEK